MSNFNAARRPGYCWLSSRNSSCGTPLSTHRHFASRSTSAIYAPPLACLISAVPTDFHALAPALFILCWCGYLTRGHHVDTHSSCKPPSSVTKLLPNICHTHTARSRKQRGRLFVPPRRVGFVLLSPRLIRDAIHEEQLTITLTRFTIVHSILIQWRKATLGASSSLYKFLPTLAILQISALDCSYAYVDCVRPNRGTMTRSGFPPAQTNYEADILRRYLTRTPAGAMQVCCHGKPTTT